MKPRTCWNLVVTFVLCVTWASIAAAKPPSWDTIKPGASRFKVLSGFNNEAVLDKETGLVWTKSPYTNSQSGLSWLGAMVTCRQNVYSGNRLGWRLPSVEELSTLIDPTAVAPHLPAGHPFECSGTCSGGLSGGFWTATLYAPPDYSSVYWVSLDAALVANSNPAANLGVWCVRGGSGAGPQ